RSVLLPPPVRRPRRSAGGGRSSFIVDLTSFPFRRRLNLLRRRRRTRRAQSHIGAGGGQRDIAGDQRGTANRPPAAGLPAGIKNCHFHGNGVPRSDEPTPKLRLRQRAGGAGLDTGSAGLDSGGAGLDTGGTASGSGAGAHRQRPVQAGTRRKSRAEAATVRPSVRRGGDELSKRRSRH